MFIVIKSNHLIEFFAHVCATVAHGFLTFRFDSFRGLPLSLSTATLRRLRICSLRFDWAREILGEKRSQNRKSYFAQFYHFVRATSPSFL